MALDISTLPPEAISALKQFPEFEIASFNDSGANGYILLGRHTVLQKLVAIKIYFHGVNDVDQEPAIIAKINHENVLKVYDARKVGQDFSYFVMPAASDGDLAQFLDTYPISLPFAHKLLCQLLSGIAALHMKPNFLVHRDLKPENLLVHDDNLLIADFGSVRRIDDKTGRAPASKHSILYRPPEAFGAAPFFNFSSDIYQAGLIGFLLFGGTLGNDLLHFLTKKQKLELNGIQGGYEQSIYVDSCLENKIKGSKLADFSTLPYYVPKAIKSALRVALSPVERRYASVSEFLAELLRLRGNLPNWSVYGDCTFLRNWNGMDYRIPHDEVVVLKCKSGTERFRHDNSYACDSYNALFERLKGQLNLP